MRQSTFEHVSACAGKGRAKSMGVSVAARAE
jgi:hypothetical protein